MNRHDEHEGLKKANVQILHQENLRILQERDIKELKKTISWLEKKISWLEAENALLRRRADAITTS